jgi:hypothetical protein
MASIALVVGKKQVTDWYPYSFLIVICHSSSGADENGFATPINAAKIGRGGKQA